MKMRSKSIVLFSLMIASLSLAGNAIAKTLGVLTTNHSDRGFAGSECISGCSPISLPAQSARFLLIPEPSSGTATLSVLLNSFTASEPVRCSGGYNVLTTSSAAVDVYVSTATHNGYCYVYFQNNR